MFDRRLLLASSMIVGLGAAILIPTQTFAQETTPTDAEATAAANPSPETTPSEPTQVEEFVITGSRIRRTEFTTPAPVDFITTDESRLKGLVDPAAVLQGSTVAAGSVQLNNQFGGFVTDGGSGINSISLRGLGAQRSLVLLNGRRLNPAGVSGTVAAVDLNVIPSSMVDRYEILKDGASSIYGSDAVAGVVNIITKSDFDGIEMEGDASVPLEGAGETYNVAVTFGRVRDAWHILGGVEYYQQNAIRMGDRSWGECPSEYQRGPGTPGLTYTRSRPDGSPYCAFTQHDYFDSLITGETYIYDPQLSGDPNFPYVLFQQDPYGSWPRVTNIPTDVRDREVDVLTPVKRASAIVTGGVDLPRNTELYFEGLLTNRQSEQNAYLPQFFPSDIPGVIAFSESPFNPFVGDPFDLGWPYPDYVQPVVTVPVSRFDQDVTAGRILLGLRGNLDFAPLHNWHWDTSFSYGGSSADYTTRPRLTNRVYNALTVVPAPTGFDPSLVRVSPVDGGSYTCAVNITNPAERCYPLNVFLGSAALTNDPSLAYITVEDDGHTSYDQIILSATIDGPLFNLPAGAVSAVFGAEMRYDKLYDYPGKEAVARNYFGQSTAGVTRGQDATTELFTELELPLIKGAPLIENLTANLSGRYTHIRSAGDDTTYKIGLNWQVVPAFRVRATYGTSYRGPALYENYLAAQTSFTSAVDPCDHYGRDTQPGDPLYDNCSSEGLDPDTFPGYSSTPEVFSQGAFGRLEPETSKNITAGVIWQPSFADFQLSIDYFKIEIENEISQLGATNILNLCYTSADFRSGSPYCTLISERDANGDIAMINDSYINVAFQRTEGFDVNARYRRELGRIGKLTLQWEGTLTQDDSVELFQGSGLDDYNGTFGDPKLVWSADADLEHGNWTFHWNAYFIGRTSFYDYLGLDPNGRYKLEQEQTIYHAASVKYEADKWSATLGMRNMFDEQPPKISNNTTGYAPRVGEIGAGYGTYDLFGRTVFVNLTKNF